MSSKNKREQLIGMFDISAVIDKLDERYAIADPTKPEVTLKRTPVVPASGDVVTAVVTKHYAAGVMKPLEMREAKLLVELMTAEVSTKQGQARLSSRVTYLRALDQTQSFALQIHMPWHGFDLDDWVKLLGKADNSLVRNPEFLLALMRSALKALHLLHLYGWVSSDCKRDNFCLPWVEGSLSAPGQPLVGKLNPDDLRLIDMGIALPKSDHRTEKLELGTKKSGGEDHEVLIRAAHLAAFSGDLNELQNLDWRCDLRALGFMFENWELKSPLFGDAMLMDGFRELYGDLKEIKLAGNAPDMPHQELIIKIDTLIGNADKYWDFTIDGAVMPGKVINPRPPKELSTFALLVVSAALLALLLFFWTSIGIQVSNAFAGKKITFPFLFATINAAGRSNAMSGDELMSTLQANAQANEKKDPSHSHTVKLLASKAAYQIGQPMEFKVTTPINGHITLLMLDQGDKWPQIHPNVDITNIPAKANATTTLPGQLPQLSAAPPLGTMRVMAVVTEKEFDWTGSFEAGKVEMLALQNAAASAILYVRIDPRK